MTLVFLLSNEVADDSTETSGSIIRIIVTLLEPNISDDVLEYRVELFQPIIRKLAHFTLYLLGGMLIYNMFMQIKVKMLFVKSFSFGAIYAITDEIHQLLIPGRSGEVRDVIIDVAGVMLGILIMSLLMHIKVKLKNRKPNINNLKEICKILKK